DQVLARRAPLVTTETLPLNASSQSPAAVGAYGLEKSFGRVRVVRGVDLEVQPGHLIGLIGPSGCGKTTLIRLLAGLAKPDHGEARLLGKDPLRRTPNERAQMGYMPQGAALFPNLTVMQNAKFTAGLYGLGWLSRRKRIRELLDYFELWDARNRRASETSGGMQRRTAMACAVIHRPDVVFVDEPTAGLDPILRAKIWDYLHGLRDGGTTIVLTTQYVEEAVYCDQVAVMLEGRIVTCGTPEELRREAFQGETAEVTGDDFTAGDMDALGTLAQVRAVERHQSGIRLIVDDLSTATPAITQLLFDRGKHIHSVAQGLPTFDEVFTELIRRHG
ncbi:MAG: ABC transporter ATP-binding protein, partial [Dehalococcoidia bacterium]